MLDELGFGTFQPLPTAVWTESFTSAARAAIALRKHQPQARDSTRPDPETQEKLRALLSQFELKNPDPQP